MKSLIYIEDFFYAFTNLIFVFLQTMIDEREVISEKAVLIGIISQKQDEIQSTEYLDELEFLTLTAGGVAVKRFVQKMEKPNPKTFLGVGKLEEVRDYIESNHIGTAIFVLFIS